MLCKDWGVRGSSAGLEVADEFERFVLVSLLGGPDHSGLWCDWRKRKWGK